MKYVVSRIYRYNQGDAFGVWHIPSNRRTVFNVQPLAIFESEDEANAFIASR